MRNMPDITWLIVVLAVVGLATAIMQRQHESRIVSRPAASSAPAQNPNPRATYTAAPPVVGTAADYAKLQATVQTERGNFTIQFYPREAPKSVASFVQLARDGFYDGLTFHRVEPGFVVQGGDPTGTGAGGPGYTVPAEFNAHKHVVGAVGLARTQDPNSAGSQFYICLAPAPMLDGQYTVFGQVVKGMENVEKVRKGDRIDKITISSRP